MNTNKLYFGTVYCPYAKSGDLSAEYWERDILTMKQLHINVVRSFVAWDRIEKDEGVYDYSSLDTIFELAGKHGMDILLNVGGTLTNYGSIYHPQWLIHDYNIQPLVEDPVTMGRQFGPLRSLCPDDPVYLEKVLAFTEKTILRYREAECLIGWDLWNEPFTWGDGCFCPLSLMSFRNWLQDKYGDLETLNQVWSSEFPVAYRRWEDVEPSGKTAFVSAGYTPRMDWIAFNRFRIRGWIDNIENLVRKNDPRQLPVTLNVVATSIFETAWMHNYSSVFDLNRNMTIPGYSAYTFYGEMEEAGWLEAMMCSWARSSGAQPENGFWAVETEAGQMSYFPKKHIRAEKGWRIASNWQMVLHGARMIMLWKFGGRNTENQTTGFNLCGWDGSITERAEIMADFADKFLKNEAVFQDKTYHADVAILVVNPAEIASIADKTHKNFMAGCHGAFKLMNNLRIPCDFIDDTWVAAGRLAKYKVLLIPSAMFMTAELAALVTEFVRNGGTVIADRFCGMKNEKSFHFQTAPGFGLQKVFGAYMNDDTFADFPETVIAAGLPELDISDLFHSHLHLTEAGSIAEFSCGGYAISHHQFGSGRAWLCGFELFHIYRTPKGKYPFITEIMKQMMEKAGVINDYRIKGDDDFNIEAGALRNKNCEKVHFLINFSDAEQNIELEIKDGGHYQDILSDFIYPAKPSPITLPPYGTLILTKK